MIKMVITSDVYKSIISLGKMPGEMQIVAKGIVTDLAKFVQKSAKMRAPKASGQLAESITINYSQNKQQVKANVSPHSPYQDAQEFGFKKHTVMPSTYSRSGYRFMDWLAMKGKPQIKTWVYKPYKGDGYFMGPAFMAALDNFDTIANKNLNEFMGGA